MNSHLWFIRTNSNFKGTFNLLKSLLKSIGCSNYTQLQIQEIKRFGTLIKYYSSGDI